MDLLAARIRAPLEQGRRRGHEAGRAEAALDPVLLVERGLHWREVPRLPERLDRRHRRALNRDQRCQARPSRLAPAPPPPPVFPVAPSTATSGVRHDLRGSPSTRTAHAPQPPCWQPAFGLVIPS